MLAIAREVGYSETAFLVPRRGGHVATCGTSAPWPRCRSAGTPPWRRAWRSRASTGRASSGSRRASGPVPVRDRPRAGRHAARDAHERRARTSTPWRPRTSPRRSPRWAGPSATSTRRSRRASRTPAPATSSSRPRPAARLAALDYDVPRLRALMESLGWTTVALVWRESPARPARPRPVPGRRRLRGSRHGRGRGGARGLPPGARSRHAPGRAHDPPGGGPRPARHAARRAAGRAARGRRQRHGRRDVSAPPRHLASGESRRRAPGTNPG